MRPTHCNNPSCGIELTHTEGRRPKKYCSIGCRNAHYKVLYPLKKKEDGLPLPKDFIEAKNIGILKEDGTVEKIFKWNGREMILQPLKELNNKIKYKEFDSSSFDAPDINEHILDEPGQWENADENTLSKKHPLYKKGDPKEGSIAFYSKYGVATYEEIENKK